MKIYEVVSTEVNKIKNEIDCAYAAVMNPSDHSKKKAIVISGDSLINIMSDDFMSKKLNDVCQKCEAVLCCRVSPKMKQQIVKLVRDNVPNART